MCLAFWPKTEAKDSLLFCTILRMTKRFLNYYNTKIFKPQAFLSSFLGLYPGLYMGDIGEP